MAQQALATRPRGALTSPPLAIPGDPGGPLGGPFGPDLYGTPRPMRMHAPLSDALLGVPGREESLVSARGALAQGAPASLTANLLALFPDMALEQAHGSLMRPRLSQSSSSLSSSASLGMLWGSAPGLKLRPDAGGPETAEDWAASPASTPTPLDTPLGARQALQAFQDLGALALEAAAVSGLGSGSLMSTASADSSLAPDVPSPHLRLAPSAPWPAAGRVSPSPSHRALGGAAASRSGSTTPTQLRSGGAEIAGMPAAGAHLLQRPSPALPCASPPAARATGRGLASYEAATEHLVGAVCSSPGLNPPPPALVRELARSSSRTLAVALKRLAAFGMGQAARELFDWVRVAARAEGGAGANLPSPQTLSLLMASELAYGEGVPGFSPLSKSSLPVSSSLPEPSLGASGSYAAPQQSFLSQAAYPCGSPPPCPPTLSHLLDEYSYTSALSLCIPDRDLPRALELFEDARLRGVEPNAHTFTALMNVCIKSGRCGAAVGVFDAMLAAGCRPTVVTFNSLLDAHGKAGDWRAGFRALESMLPRHEVKPVLRTYNTLMIGCNASHAPRAALRAYALLKEQGLMPNATTCNTLLAVLGKLGRLDLAAAVYLRMKGGLRCERSALTYSALLSAALRARRWDTGLCVAAEARQEKHALSAGAQALLAHALAHAGQVDALLCALARGGPGGGAASCPLPPLAQLLSTPAAWAGLDAGALAAVVQALAAAGRCREAALAFSSGRAAAAARPAPKSGGAEEALGAHPELFALSLALWQTGALAPARLGLAVLVRGAGVGLPRDGVLRLQGLGVPHLQGSPLGAQLRLVAALASLAERAEDLVVVVDPGDEEEDLGEGPPHRCTSAILASIEKDFAPRSEASAASRRRAPADRALFGSLEEVARAGPGTGAGALLAPCHLDAACAVLEAGSSPFRRLPAGAALPSGEPVLASSRVYGVSAAEAAAWVASGRWEVWAAAHAPWAADLPSTSHPSIPSLALLCAAAAPQAAPSTLARQVDAASALDAALEAECLRILGPALARGGALPEPHLASWQPQCWGLAEGPGGEDSPACATRRAVAAALKKEMEGCLRDVRDPLGCVRGAQGPLGAERRRRSAQAPSPRAVAVEWVVRSLLLFDWVQARRVPGDVAPRPAAVLSACAIHVADADVDVDALASRLGGRMGADARFVSAARSPSFVSSLLRVGGEELEGSALPWLRGQIAAAAPATPPLSPRPLARVLIARCTGLLSPSALSRCVNALMLEGLARGDWAGLAPLHVAAACLLLARHGLGQAPCWPAGAWSLTGIGPRWGPAPSAAAQAAWRALLALRRRRQAAAEAAEEEDDDPFDWGSLLPAAEASGRNLRFCCDAAAIEGSLGSSMPPSQQAPGVASSAPPSPRSQGLTPAQTLHVLRVVAAAREGGPSENPARSLEEAVAAASKLATFGGDSEGAGIS